MKKNAIIDLLNVQKLLFWLTNFMQYNLNNERYTLRTFFNFNLSGKAYLADEGTKIE